MTQMNPRIFVNWNIRNNISPECPLITHNDNSFDDSWSGLEILWIPPQVDLDMSLCYCCVGLELHHSTDSSPQHELSPTDLVQHEQWSFSWLCHLITSVTACINQCYINYLCQSSGVSAVCPVITPHLLWLTLSHAMLILSHHWQHSHIRDNGALLPLHYQGSTETKNGVIKSNMNMKYEVPKWGLILTLGKCLIKFICPCVYHITFSQDHSFIFLKCIIQFDRVTK